MLTLHFITYVDVLWDKVILAKPEGIPFNAHLTW